MTESKRNSRDSWDPDTAPEIPDDAWERAQISIGGKVIREATGTLTKRGRPPVGDEPKQQVTLRLAPKVINYFKQGGDGWQTRLNETLEEYVTAAVVADVKRKSVPLSDLAKEAQAKAKDEQSGKATARGSANFRSAATGKLSATRNAARSKRSGTNKRKSA